MAGNLPLLAKIKNAQAHLNIYLGKYFQIAEELVKITHLIYVYILMYM